MAIDLIFSGAPATNASLVFGAETGGPVSKDASLGLTASLPGLSGTIWAAQRTEDVGFAAGLPELDGEIALVSQASSKVGFAATLPALDGEVSITSVAHTTLLLSGSLPALAGTFALSQVNPATLTFAGTFPALSGSLALAYDNQVTSWLDSRVMVSHQTAIPDRAHADVAWAVSTPNRESVVHGWQSAQTALVEKTAHSFLSSAVRLPTTALWTLADQTERPSIAAHQQALACEQLRRWDWQDADRRQTETAGSLQTGIFKVLQPSCGWQVAAVMVRDLMRRLGASPHRLGVQSALMPWEMAGQARNGLSLLPAEPGVTPPVYVPGGALLFECPPLTGLPLHLVFGARACYLPARAHVVVPFLRTYVTINSISLRRVDGDLAIPSYAFQMSLDVDSWTWSWSASVSADALPLVQPGSNGEPVEVEALVNDVPYRLYAESIASQRQFGQARIAVKGRGKAAMLDAPYAPVLNHGSTAQRTAQQLMLDVLTINGVGIGWAVDWGLTDWLVPGNTWTHQGAYIGAVLNIAQAAGGYVQPHDTAQTLRILPRYPAAPWDWAAITPDFELPAAVVAVEGIDWARKADYNRVFVSGMSNGVLGQITRAGTAGDSVAPMVTDALITHADAARQRGVAILSDTGNQARVTLTLPVLAQTGLIKPGQFVRYLDGRQTRLGLVRSNSLAWSRPKLRQTISVETHA